MNSILIGVGVIAGLWVLRKVLNFLILRGVSGVVGRAIGSHALAQQPDAIHLTPCVASAWTNSQVASGLSSAFTGLGFRDAGTYRVPELPGVIVQLLANSQDRLYAAVYEHPQAGNWFDVVSRFENGTSTTYTSSNPTGLDPRPGHPVVNVPGSRPQVLVERARSEAVGKRSKPANCDDASKDFETTYAESIAWRKKKGVTAQEVGRVATRKAA